MPYHSNSSCIVYTETLDKIEGIINNVTSPFMNVRDMYASLPPRAKLQLSIIRLLYKLFI